MQTLNKFLSYKIKTIAIVDSASEGPEMTLPYWDVEFAGFAIVHVPEDLQTIPEIINFVQEHAQAVVTSHRLGGYGEPMFYGAELAAALYDLGIPTLLVTQYLDIDQHSSIRRWRDKLPVVLELHEVEPFMLRQHLDLCVNELRGYVPESRLPYRVMLCIESIQGDADERYIDVSVDYWDHHQRVRMPMSLLPADLQATVVAGSWLFAMVNIKAEYAHELYFRDFLPAYAPECDENMSYCVNVLDDINVSENPMLWFEKQQMYEQELEVEEFTLIKNISN
ncbi:hypothetical protein KDA_11970 [Dictyobacter alpinus]|uniref:Uncharacterized protein n=1 Tax=Dictyobacter alpinus TaxID=2014873 RepID=A0A402B310_9CHLR|nr:hypothetical protein [Dictyobacter alpinus]GCE25713.1 hypothetical protein KDA_11970 [Dictyobacter alpinus]